MLNKERSVKFFERVWNERDENALSGFLHPDVTAYFEGGVICKGMEEVRAWMHDVLKAMPDLHFDVIDVIEEDPKVVVRWRATATVGGQTEMVQGMTWFLHRGDAIVEGGDCWNKGALDAKLERAAATAA
ncbi:MAG: hypothetical protein GC160_27450 [Acidobacteria bacterium]|nr:hypothetical protein [Acidobacteriota bacterium]